MRLNALICGSTSEHLACGCILFITPLAHALQWWRKRISHCATLATRSGSGKLLISFVCKVTAEHKC